MNDPIKKKYSILGDSISTFAGYSEPEGAEFYDAKKKKESGVYSRKDTWWGLVIDALDGELLVDNAISGSTLCGGPLYEYPSYACSDERTSSLGKNGTDPDVIFVYIGTNDWGRATAIRPEEQPDPAKRDPEWFFLPAYERMLEKLKRNYPNAAIYCFTMARSRFSRSETFSFPYAYRGRHIEEYVEVVRASAAKYGCHLVDLYRYAEPYETIDGFHPNAEGMVTLAKAVLEQIQKA